jgi:hypothetical protein
LYLVVRALIVEISMILVRESRGDLSVVDYQVIVPVMLLGRFALRGNKFKLLVEGKSKEDV